MAFIVICSLVAIAVSIHRFISLRWDSIIPSFLRTELVRCDQYFIQRKTSALYGALKGSDTPIGHIGRVALSSDFKTREEATEAVEATAHEEMVKMERGMGILEVIITIAPLLGLLGTVSGLVSVFGVLGDSTSADVDPKLLATGIAEALTTTIAGLVVAVVTVILHSYFTRRLESVGARLEVRTSHLMHQFYKHGGPLLYREEQQQPQPEQPQA